MIGLLCQLRAVAYIMEKNSVSNRIRRYVDVISAKLHPLNQSGMARPINDRQSSLSKQMGKTADQSQFKEKVQNTIDNMKQLKNDTITVRIALK